MPAGTAGIIACGTEAPSVLRVYVQYMQICFHFSATALGHRKHEAHEQCHQESSRGRRGCLQLLHRDLGWVPGTIQDQLPARSISRHLLILRQPQRKRIGMDLVVANTDIAAAVLPY